MIDLDHSDLLSPSGLHRLMAYAGLTAEQAFDELARRAATPAFHAEIQHFCSTPAGRDLLAQVRRLWDREGLPMPFDNLLELGPVS